MRKSSNNELDLSARTDYLKYSFLMASIADVMWSNPEHLESKKYLLDKAINVLNNILEGYEFIYEKRATNYARENVNLYSIYSDSYETRIGKQSKEGINVEMKNYLKQVISDIELIKKDPTLLNNPDISDSARKLFASLSDSLNAQLR